MKKWMYLVLLVIVWGCEKDFDTWNVLNTNFLTENKTHYEVSDSLRVMYSGLQYKTFHNGYGAIAKPNSYVKVTYVGRLVDGTVFDSGNQVWLPVEDLIIGWQEALCMMPQGSHWQIYVPYTIAYGVEGSKRTSGNFHIPPYSTLIFDLEVNDVINP
ncbi:MAG TPA: FKBP-type peptidyl-prolyl cis-trans isomerase [Paludibacteraceae bacterium]|nr:FKBP-type peptidyl-prolyl cis-trans isomerase [Paludibacteraceae bacterium]